MKIEDSRSVEENDLFVRMKNYGEKEEVNYGWYKLSGKDEEKEESGILSPCFKHGDPDFHHRSTQVSLGPFIVVIGGGDFQYNKMYRDVFVIDTRNPDAGWKKGPKLLTAREGAYAFVLCNTICVLGGQWMNSHPDGEVLDLETGIWKWFKTSIDTPSGPPYEIHAHLITYKDKDDDEEGLLFKDDLESEYAWHEYNTAKTEPPHPKDLYIHGTHYLCSYNFDNGIWKIIDDKVHSSANQSASVDDVLYVLSPQLRGYSVKEGIWFDVSLSALDEYPNSLPPPNWSTPPSCLVHLGNSILCLLWSNPETSKNVVLYCTKFTIKFHKTDDGTLSATAQVKSFNKYEIPPGRLVDCVTVGSSGGAAVKALGSFCSNAAN